jgi:hypothetical protein
VSGGGEVVGSSVTRVGEEHDVDVIEKISLSNSRAELLPSNALATISTLCGVLAVTQSTSVESSVVMPAGAEG